MYLINSLGLIRTHAGAGPHAAEVTGGRASISQTPSSANDVGERGRAAGTSKNVFWTSRCCVAVAAALDDRMTGK